MTLYKVTRDVTKEECFWLDETVIKGTIVYPFYGCTYGCISDNGIAVSLISDVNPFFELPLNSLEKIEVTDNIKNDNVVFYNV